MTATLKAEYLRADTIHISIKQDKFSPLYIVTAAKAEKNLLYPISTNTYSTITKARRRYNELRRKYK